MSTVSKTLPLEYTQKVLEKMSFDAKIFRKELRKALKNTAKQDWQQLMTWCREKFGRRKR